MSANIPKQNKLPVTSKIFNSSLLKENRKFLRNNMVNAEIVMWRQLRNKQIDNCRFRRQYSIGRFIVDFYCPELKLAIEIDGDTHIQGNNPEYDKERQKIIESLEINFLRFTNSEVYHNMEYVLETIYDKIEKLRKSD